MGPVYYYNYKCETETCSFKGKSVRAGVILNFAKDFFDEYRFTTKSNYDSYVKDAEADIKLHTQTLVSSIASLTKQLGDQKRNYEETKELVKNNPSLAKHYDLDKEDAKVKVLEEQLEAVHEQRKKIKSSIFTYEQYLELFNNVSVILDKMDNMEAMDKVLRNFFSNFTIRQYGTGKKQRWEIDYNLKEPYQGFLQNDNVLHGRGERTRTFDLTVPNRAR